MLKFHNADSIIFLNLRCLIFNFMCFMEKKPVYVVIADPWNEDDGFDICAICDREDLALSFCKEVLVMTDKYRQVYVSEYFLNCIEAWLYD